MLGISLFKWLRIALLALAGWLVVAGLIALIVLAGSSVLAVLVFMAVTAFGSSVG